MHQTCGWAAHSYAGVTRYAVMDAWGSAQISADVWASRHGSPESRPTPSRALRCQGGRFTAMITGQISLGLLPKMPQRIASDIVFVSWEMPPMAMRMVSESSSTEIVRIHERPSETPVALQETWRARETVPTLTARTSR